MKSERVSGITVQGINQDEVMSLPTIYTRDCIPATPPQIQTPEKIKDWLHLQKLVKFLTTYMDIEVGLLIGAVN